MGLHHRVPAVCSVLGTRKFLDSAGLDLVKRSGPEQSTTTKFHYAIGLRACEDISDRTVSAPLLPEIGRRPRDDAGGITARMRDAVVVIQCAKSKDPNAGHLRLGNGRRVTGVVRMGGHQEGYAHPPYPGPRPAPYIDQEIINGNGMMLTSWACNNARWATTACSFQCRSTRTAS